MFASKRRNSVDRTTWEFLQPGWWGLHALTIAAAVYLGKRLGNR